MQLFRKRRSVVDDLLAEITELRAASRRETLDEAVRRVLPKTLSARAIRVEFAHLERIGWMPPNAYQHSLVLGI